MTAIQPCRVEDVASDFGQRGDFGRIGTFPSGAVAAGSGSAADDAEGSTRDHLSQRDEQLDHQGVEQSDDLLDMGQEYESPDEEPLSWNLQLLLQYLADTDRDSPSVAEEQDFRDVAGEPDPDTDHVMVMLDFLTRHYLTRLIAAAEQLIAAQSSAGTPSVTKRRTARDIMGDAHPLLTLRILPRVAPGSRCPFAGCSVQFSGARDDNAPANRT